MTARLEASAARAWPSFDTAEVAGWTCRRAAGYTQRANSCLPMVPAAGPNGDRALGPRVDAVEAWYAASGLPVVFKVPEEPAWGPLDTLLEDRGYALATRSQVWGLSLGPKASAEAPPPPAEASFEASDTFDAAWWQAWSKASGLDPVHRPTAEALGARVERPVVARMRWGSADAAWAFASLEGDQAWIFDVVVDPDHRRRGLGRLLVSSLAAAAAAQGAQQAWLQVLGANTAARNLYRSLGWKPVYSYHYRRLELTRLPGKERK